MLKTKEKPNKNINRVDQVLWRLETLGMLDRTEEPKDAGRTILRLNIPSGNYLETINRYYYCEVDTEFVEEIEPFASRADRSEIEYLKRIAQRCCIEIERKKKKGRVTTQLFLE
jgi:hypothetical protein